MRPLFEHMSENKVKVRLELDKHTVMIVVSWVQEYPIIVTIKF